MEDDTLLQYYLDGTEYEITLEALCHLLGFPHTPEAVTVPTWEPDSSFYDFSCQLIGGPRRTYKASQISHPVFRYIQRALAFTIFARGETVGTMGECETYFMYAMLHALSSPEKLPHVGSFFLDNLINVRNNATPGGLISCGGFVTRLAIHHGVIPVAGPVYRTLAPRLQKQTEFIDMAYLRTADIFTQVGNSFFFISDHVHVPLPLPVHVERTDPATWILPPGLALQPGAAPAAQPAGDPFAGPQAAEQPQPPPFWAPGPGQATPQQMYELMQTMNTNISNLATQSEQQYTQLRNYVDERFNAVNERFDTVDRQMADLRTYVDSQFTAHHTYMTGQFGTSHTDMTQLTAQMGGMQVQYTDLAGAVDEIAEQQHGTYHRTERMYTHMSTSGYISADPIPSRRRRPRRPSPREMGTQTEETAQPPPPA